MSAQGAKSQIAARRAQLMVELLLQDFEPEFISRPTSADVGYDLLAGFLNRKKGINTFAIEVKATERPPKGSVQILRNTFERFAHSNIPALLFVADVKQNKLYYAWLNAKKSSGAPTVSVPLTALDDSAKAGLSAELRATDSGLRAAG